MYYVEATLEGGIVLECTDEECASILAERTKIQETKVAEEEKRKSEAEFLNAVIKRLSMTEEEREVFLKPYRSCGLPV